MHESLLLIQLKSINFIHSFIHLSIHSFIYSFVRSFIHSFKMVSEKYDLTESSTHRCFHRVCTAIKNHLTPTIICWPREEYMAEQEAAFEKHRRFPGVLGAIDGCHTPISAP